MAKGALLMMHLQLPSEQLYHPFDLHELRQAEYGAVHSPLWQGALPSAYNNYVLRKTL